MPVGIGADLATVANHRAGRMATLTVISPAGDREQCDLTTFPFHIGRQTGNQLVLRDNRISRLHARLIERGAGVAIEDCGSTHGVYVNGARLGEPRVLQPGDRIRFGESATGEAADGYQLVFQWREGALPGLVDRMPGSEHLAKLRSLVEVARALRASLAPEEVLAAVLDAALNLTHSRRAYLLLKRDGVLEVSQARGTDGQTLAPSAGAVPLETIRQLLATRGLMPASAIDGGLCVPLVRHRTDLSQQTVAISVNDTVGALYLAEPEQADLAEGNRELLETLAAEASAVLENAALLEQDQERQRMEQELEVARRIQLSLLPRRMPATGWFRAAGSSEPTFEVGGDFYDLIHIPPAAGCPDMWSLVMADVSGKGASSALLAGLLQGAFLMAPENSADIAAVLQHLNRYLNERTSGEKYATIFYGALEENGLLRWANAGHSTPFLLRAAAEGQIEPLDTNAMPVGLLDGADFSVAKTQLAPGDKLVLFSDGLCDAHNAAGETFDRPLRRLLRKAPRTLTAVELHDHIWHDLRAFTNGIPQPDDITVLVAEYHP